MHLLAWAPNTTQYKWTLDSVSYSRSNQIPIFVQLTARGEKKPEAGVFDVKIQKEHGKANFEETDPKVMELNDATGNGIYVSRDMSQCSTI